MKKFLTLMLCLVLTLGCVGIFTACNNPEDSHTHSYAKVWTSNSTHHWHVATCEHTTEVGGKAEHSYNNFGRCTVCHYQGTITYNKVDATTWVEAFESLWDMRNFTIGGIQDLQYPIFDIPRGTTEVMEDAVHWCLQGAPEGGYRVFTEEGVTDYNWHGGVWNSISGYMDDGYFERLTQPMRLFVNIHEIPDIFDEFNYDETTKAYLWQWGDNGERSFEVKFVGSNLYSIKMMDIIPGEGTYTVFLDDIGNTWFEVEPLHEHDYSTVWSSSNLYHWHKAVCHDGELDVKVSHTWGAENKCTVCGHVKSAVKSEVSKQQFEEALRFKGLTNWSYWDETIGDNFKRAGDLIQMGIRGEISYAEVMSDGSAWHYFEVSEGVWEKMDGVILGLDALNIQSVLYDRVWRWLAVLTELWDELTFENGVYTVEHCEGLFSLIGFEDATVNIAFDDGEIVSISIKGTYDVVDAEIIFNEVGTTTVTLPNATVHTHNYVISAITSDRHSSTCTCGHYYNASHDYDETVADSVCSVCGAKNHEHVYDRYTPDKDRPNYHKIICECGVQLWSDPCEYEDGSNVCSKCGAIKHEHSWVYSGSLDEDRHYMECETCGANDWGYHDCEGTTPCSVCGYYVHNHEWVVTSKGDVDAHKVKCSVCGFTCGEVHDFSSGDICSKCGATKHYHNWIYDESRCWYDFDRHEIYCPDCGRMVWEEHVYTESTTCDVCGYNRTKKYYDV